ncbi:MAG: transposase [Boseongicola sp. SB0673_bin_14]|nr:transposase [Boseongicola sp. SB0667_bin_21]MYI69923.1 transposase [Boseongicola sp. SB0673_bin_14]
MATVNGTSLREELDDAEARIAELRKDGKVTEEVDAVIRVLFTLLSVMITVLLERATRKTSRNSGLPPSQTESDETARRGGRDSGKGAKPNLQTGDNLRKTVVEETVAVEACDACGADLSGVGPVGSERRVLHDIVFEVVERRVDAEVKECPDCRARTKGRFPDDMPGPLQYGAGLQAFVVNLLVAHMLSLRRAVALVQAISGLRLSEATCLGYVRRLDDALMSWEEAAVAHLLERPALHADETGFRVDGRTEWLHVLTDGSLTLKVLHR